MSAGMKAYRPCQVCRAQSPREPTHEGKYICAMHRRELAQFQRELAEHEQLATEYRARQTRRANQESA